MSDFVSDFWHFYVAGIVLVSVIGCAVFLWSQGSATFTVGKTTGHAWDETLEEYNNPLPVWWSLLFYITVVFSLIYLALYPGLGKFPGILGWTSSGQWKAEQARAAEQFDPEFNRYLAMDVKALAADKKAMDMGKSLFKTYCMQCHGADAKGSSGFPNLTDNDWQYGGDPAQIYESIANGRIGVMTPHAHLGTETIDDLVNYVQSLSGLPNDHARALKGQEAFATVGCTACHGMDAKGNQALGAPNLTDNIWLYGRSDTMIRETITHGRQNKMPAWKDFLGDAKVHLLAAYVYSLSNNGTKQ